MNTLHYFHSTNIFQRNFLTTTINEYADYLDGTDIEIGILLCDELADAETDGCTYKEIKQASKLLDVIELARQREEDEDIQDANSDHHDPVGYDEVRQVLRSFLWSNVQAGSRVVTGNYNHGFDYTGESMSGSFILQWHGGGRRVSLIYNILLMILQKKQLKRNWPTLNIC